MKAKTPGWPVPRLRTQRYATGTRPRRPGSEARAPLRDEVARARAGLLLNAGRSMASSLAEMAGLPRGGRTCRMHPSRRAQSRMGEVFQASKRFGFSVSQGNQSHTLAGEILRAAERLRRKDYTSIPWRKTPATRGGNRGGNRPGRSDSRATHARNPRTAVKPPDPQGLTPGPSTDDPRPTCRPKLKSHRFTQPAATAPRSPRFPAVGRGHARGPLRPGRSPMPRPVSTQRCRGNSCRGRSSVRQGVA